MICSHVQGVVDSIWNTRPFLTSHFVLGFFYSGTGPVIEEAETLRQTVQRSRDLSAGNEENRRFAVKVVRRCIELLIRAVCRHTNSTPPPFRATVNISNMLPFFRACPGALPAQAQGLHQTITFSNPGPHTQVGWAVPVEANITPHIDRIRQTADNSECGKHAHQRACEIRAAHDVANGLEPPCWPIAAGRGVSRPYCLRQKIKTLS